METSFCFALIYKHCFFSLQISTNVPWGVTPVPGIRFVKTGGQVTNANATKDIEKKRKERKWNVSVSCLNFYFYRWWIYTVYADACTNFYVSHCQLIEDLKRVVSGSVKFIFLVLRDNKMLDEAMWRDNHNLRRWKGYISLRVPQRIHKRRWKGDQM